MKISYTFTKFILLDTKKAKHLKIFVNPFGGAGKAENDFNQSVMPIFDAAGCTCEITS